MDIDFSNINSAVHGPIRLGVLTAIQIDGPLDFTTIKKRLNVADGALGTHLQKLETLGYIICHKEFVGRRPKSTYHLTDLGKTALFEYLQTMQEIIDSTNANNPQEPDS